MDLLRHHQFAQFGVRRHNLFTRHARTQMLARKVTEEEIQETILTATWEEAEQDRKTCHKTFPFSGQHYGRYYRSKDVVPIFKEEEDNIVVITVYTFFSQKEVGK